MSTNGLQTISDIPLDFTCSRRALLPVTHCRQEGRVDVKLDEFNNITGKKPQVRYIKLGPNNCWARRRFAAARSRSAFEKCRMSWR